MAGVHWLEAAQQVSAVCLLAQVEHHQLGANLQQQRVWVSYCVFRSLQWGLQKRRKCMMAVAHNVLWRIVVYMEASQIRTYCDHHCRCPCGPPQTCWETPSKVSAVLIRLS